MEFVMLCDTDTLRACRICLDVSDPLHSIQDLSDVYEQLSGIPISPSDGLPKMVCCVCRALLNRAAALRAHTLHTHAVLAGYLKEHGMLTNENLQVLSLNHYKTSFGTTPTQTHTNLDPIDVKTEVVIVKQEDTKALEPKIANEDTENDDFKHIDDDEEEMDAGDDNSDDSADPTYSDGESSDSEDGKPIVAIRNKFNTESDKLKEVRVKKPKNIDGEKDLKAYCHAILRSVNTIAKYKFYEHIVAKYVDKTKPKDHNPPAADVNNVSTEVEEEKKEFYDFIERKYVKKEIDNRKPIQITKVNSNSLKKVASKVFKSNEEKEQFSKDFNCEFVQLTTLAEKIACLESKKDDKKYKDAAFKCDICYEGYMVEVAFNKHKLCHDPSTGPHECPVCHKRYARRLEWARHLLRHNAKITCRLCSKISLSTNLAKHHFLTHSGQEYICEHCGKFFVRYKSKLEHVRIHHGSVCCPLCYELYTPFGLKVHTTRAHSETFPCVGCNTVLANAAARDRHTQYCGTPGLVCAVCGESMPPGDGWQRHTDAHRAKKPYKQFAQRVRGRGPTTVICEICAKVYKSEAALRLHQLSHSGERPLRCPHCDSCFRYKQTLDIHIRSHTGERPYKCETCEKTFKTRGALRVHQLVHTQVRRFLCDLCPKAFQTKYNLQMHVRCVHQGVPAPPRVRKRKHN